MRTFVEFTALFPDDDKWDDAGNLLTPGGHAIMMWLLRTLQASGFECGEVTQKSFYGWQFQVHFGKTISQFVIQTGSTWLLTCDPVTPLWRRLFGCTDVTLQNKVLSAVDFVLKNDPRISNVRWFSREEYEAGKNERKPSGSQKVR